MKNKTILLVLAMGSALSAGELRAQTIGVQFAANEVALSSNDLAGMILQDNFNIVNITVNGGTSGTTGSLTDSNGSATGITLTHSSDDGFTSGTDTSTPDGILLYGEDKTGPVGGLPTDELGQTSTYTFNSVPFGTYNLIAYIQNDWLGVTANITAGATTYYVIEQSGGGTPTFLSANNTDPNNRATGNYVEFFNLTPTDNQLTITLTAEGGGNNTAGFNGLQLQSVPEPSTYALFGLGALLLTVAYRRKRA